MRKLIASGSRFEPEIGFSRAVRVGPFLAVSGTAPIAPDGSVASPGDLYGQTKRCLEIIAKAIGEGGLTMDSVIRTRVMLTDISRWKEAIINSDSEPTRSDTPLPQSLLDELDIVWQERDWLNEDDTEDAINW